ncbi:MAG: beta-ketoacyl-ACP synthase II [Chloroflexota bacterium]|nr:beta-ketoacyl-ACP synthase II [Chloroflexota bacterium]
MVNRTARVAITGLGVICPLGHSAAESWAGAISGKSGVDTITRFDASGFESTIAAEVKKFDPVFSLGKKESRRWDRYSQFAVIATREALGHAALDPSTIDMERVGVIIGTGMGGIETIELGAQQLFGEPKGRLSPFFIPMLLPNMAAGTVAIVTGAKGPTFAPVSACASSAHAIGEAAAIIRRGDADVMIAGGAEAPITKLGVAGFNAMGALSTRNGDPSGASRPFDADRDGFVLGEGAAVLILESWASAEKRNATVLAELVGYGSTDDANHMVQPAPDGSGAERAMRLAMEQAGITANAIDYVNAHGTSTQLNEKLETKAMKAAFGDAAYQIPISSTKSMSGHLLGAAGSLEAAFCLQAMSASVLPPTINYERVDPDCDLDYVPREARKRSIRIAMSNSMGFGGHNVSLIFAAVT